MIKHIYAFVFSFQFINFLWIMAVIGYLINKYVIPSIDQAMQAKEDAKTALKNVVSSTQEECKKVEDYSQEQKLYAQELLEKLKIWNAAVDITRAQETKHKQQGTRAITALVKNKKWLYTICIYLNRLLLQLCKILNKSSHSYFLTLINNKIF
jgi:hypothetical protein